MAFNIDEFKANFLGGARGSKFLVEVPYLPDKFNKFLVQSTSIPSLDIEEVAVKYMGATVKLAGERTYADWSVTALLDEDYAGIEELENWQNIMREPKSGLGNPSHASYKKEAFVSQLSQDGTVIATYKFEGLFPSSIGERTLEAGNSEVMTVSVTFKYDDMIRVSR